MPFYNIQDWERLQYSDNVLMVAQQMRNPFMDAITVMPATGSAQSVADLVGEADYSYGEDRSRRNPETPISGSRRWVVRPPVIEAGKYIDKEDQFDNARDPTSTYVRTLTAAAVRGYADRILGIRKNPDNTFSVTDGGILGSATEGKRGTSSVALPAGQTIAVGTTGLTLAKLQLAVKTLRLANFDIGENDDQLYCAITPYQVDDLLSIAAGTSAYLNAFQQEQLRTGEPTPLMGVTWIVTNRLPLDANGNRLCPVWSKNNIIAGEWQGIRGDMWNDTSAKRLPYCYVSAYVDCVRAQDKGVIVITCKEA